MIVAFTGHRPDKLGGYRVPNPIYRHVCCQIEKALKELQPEKVISGMALGVDQWAAYIAHKLKIPFTAAIPFQGQETAWPLQSQNTYKSLLKLASEQVIVSPGKYHRDKMQVRNEWMVNQCDKLIAVYNGDTTGGTANCVKYAIGIGKDIYYIDPTLPKSST